MKGRKDKIVDFFRCFFLGLAIALLILLGVIGYSVYRSSTREIDESLLVIVDDTEALTEEASGTETTQSEEAQQTLPEESVTEEETERALQEETADFETSSAQTAEGVIVVEGEEATADAGTEEESTGIYTTLLQSCNFRSEASYTDADGNDTTICSYTAGTTVEYLETVGGWVKVRIDGVVGYIGAQFIDIS